MTTSDQTMQTRPSRRLWVVGVVVAAVAGALALTVALSHTSAAADVPAGAAITAGPAVTAASAVAPVAAVAPAAQVETSTTGNWMQDLLPQVDPSGKANWIFERNQGWGASDGHNIYIDPAVPADKRYSVMVHEYSHVLQAEVFGSLEASAAALGGAAGNEKTADCMAQLQGATWVNYGCPDNYRAAATAILAGQLPS